jgi:uncharacterized protein YbaA (DUF1428 family)
MDQYADSFVFPIHKDHLEVYRKVAQEVAQIWIKHGALSYQEFAADDLHFPGTQSFADTLSLKEGETLIIGFTLFPSKAIRDRAQKTVGEDPRMAEIVDPLLQGERMIFDASRMVFGGFSNLVSVTGEPLS